MRISNPRTFAGDLPLATREYVNVKANELSGTINSTAVGLSAYIDSVSGNIHDYIDENVIMLSSAFTEVDNALSGHIDANKKEVLRWLQGTNEPGTLHDPATSPNGYAWLASDGKIDPALMPPISLTNVITINQFLFITELADWLSSSSEQWSYDPATNKLYIDNAEVDDEYALIEEWLRITVENGQYKHIVQTGDMIVLTWNKEADLKSTDNAPITKDEISLYDRFFNFGLSDEDCTIDKLREKYVIDNNIIGQYIVTKGTNSEENNPEVGIDAGNSINNNSYTIPAPQVQKLTVPDGTVRTILGQSPDQTGNVKLKLSQLLTEGNGNRSNW